MISLFRPCYGEEELEALRPVFQSGWIGLGPQTSLFEERFAAYVGASHCVGLNSGTSALDMALRLLDIGRGSEVIVPAMTFVSTAHAVAYNLAQPVFSDVDYDTLSITPEEIARRKTRRTRAIMVVHYGGRPAALDELKDAAGEIPIIEDAAHATGSIYKGRHVGTFGKAGCFSFHAVKNLAMGDGGALVVSDPEMMERAKRLRWLGIDKNTWLGLVQLAKLEAMNLRRREIAAIYREMLGTIDAVELPLEDDENHQSSWHIFHIKCDNRNRLSSYLSSDGISTGVHYKPIHLYSCYGNRSVLPVAEKAFERILSLPMHPALSNEDVEKVGEAVKRFYRR
jgi:perosamine synthetase